MTPEQDPALEGPDRMPEEYKRAFAKNEISFNDITKNIKDLFTSIDEPYVAITLKEKLEQLKRQEKKEGKISKQKSMFFEKFERSLRRKTELKSLFKRQTGSPTDLNKSKAQTSGSKESPIRPAPL